MIWTKEKEQAFKDADKAHKEACEVLRPLDEQRELVVNKIGELLSQLPKGSGNYGAGRWAIARAQIIVDMLSPFIPKEPTQ